MYSYVMPKMYYDAAVTNHFKIFINGVQIVTGSTINENDVIVAIADDGFMFNSGQPTLGYKNARGINRGKAFTDVSSDKRTATLPFILSDFDTFASINGISGSTTVYIPPVPVYDRVILQADLTKFNNSNVSLFINDVVAVDGSGIVSGDVLKFETIGSFKFSRATNFRDDDGSVIIFNIVSDTVQNFNYISNGIGSFNIATETSIVKVPSFIFTQKYIDVVNNNHTSMLVDGVPLQLNDKIYDGDVLTLTANTGYSIRQARFQDGFNEYFDFVIATDKKTATYTFFDDVLTSLEITTIVTGTVDPDPDNPPQTGTLDRIITNADLTVFINNNVTLFINDVVAVNGSEIYTNDILKFVAYDNYRFDSVVKYRNDDGFFVDFTSISPSINTLTYSGNGIGNFIIDTILMDEPDVSGINDVYLLQPDQTRQIIKDSFVFFNGQESIDFSKYMLGLIELPFTIDNSLILLKKFIQLGDYQTTIKADLLKVDVLTINMGSITVNGKYDNLLDYANTTAIINLPFSDPINIDIDYVINQTIKIQYVVSLYDGTTTINISSSKINGVIASNIVEIGVLIPFANVDSAPSKNNPNNIKLANDNGIKTPYIEILRNDAILENGFFTIPVADETLLIEQKGFVKIDEIDLKVKASKDEKEMILNAINQGVIIK